MAKFTQSLIRKLGHDNLILIFIYVIGLCLFALLLVFVQRAAGSDDTVFPVQIRPYPTLFDWLNYRYSTWSGRISSESFVYIFSPLSLVFWKIVTLVAYATISGFTFLYYLLFTAKRSVQKDRFMMVLALVLAFGLSYHVLKDAVFWVTGSMNYFWPVMFAVAAPYPLFHYIRHRKLPSAAVCTISLVSTCIAASSQEQIGSILSTLLLIVTIYIFVRLKPTLYVQAYMVGLSVLTIISFYVMLSAPGNHVRLASETIKWLPDFYTVPLPLHIEYAYRWILDSIINKFGILLILLWSSLLLVFSRKKHSNDLSKAGVGVATILAISLVFLCLKGFDAVSYWCNFYPTWSVHAPRSSYLVLVPWTIVLLATLTGPILAFGKQKMLGWLISLLVLASFLSVAIITLSPTMYASGLRVLFVPSIVMSFAVYLVFGRGYDTLKKVSVIIFAAVCCVIASQYFLLLGGSFLGQLKP